MANIADQLPHASHVLMNAACTGDIDSVLPRLSNITSLEPDKNGYTVLHYAAVNGHARLVQGIVARGFKVDAKDNLGYTALHLAASRGHIDVVQILLSVSRAINSQDKVHGNSAVHEAAWNGFSQTLHELVAAKANVNAINSAGFSALHLAAQNGHNESSRILLFAGCSPDHRNSYGDTPLHTAARYGHAGVTQILISAKCGVNETNKNGDTALHIAAAQKQKKITKLLLEAGVDIRIYNNKETALDIARRKDFDDLAVLISKVQVSSPRKLSKVHESSRAMSNSAAPVTDKKKWTSIFKKNKSKDKLLGGVETVPESVNAGTDGRHGDTQPPVYDPSRAVGYSDFQQYHMLKHQHQHRGHDASFSSMTMSPPDAAREDGRMVRGILSRYTPVHGVQYYRDLAGNVRQGPVGYVGVSDGSSAVQYIPNEPVAHQYPPQQSFQAFGGYNTLNLDSVRQKDHLSYLRNRHAAAGFVDVPSYPTVNRGHVRAFCPTYLDQSGRPWPALYPTVAAAIHHPSVPSRQPCSSRRDFDAQSEMSVPGDGGRPMYRSRSDETLSTVSSRPSFRPHRVRHAEKKSHRKSAARNQHQCRAIIEGRPMPPDIAAPNETEHDDVIAGVESPMHNDVDAVQLSKYVDSSSNPDSGYSGMSNTAPLRPPAAPRSESSSLRSESSGDVISGGKAPTLGSSCRSDSVVSLCNSL